jgi:hypothetical protein
LRIQRIDILRRTPAANTLFYGNNILRDYIDESAAKKKAARAAFERWGCFKPREETVRQ